MRTAAWVFSAAVAVALVVCGAAAAVRRPSLYEDGLYRFSIEPPAFPPAEKNSSVVPVIMAAPLEGGFNSNVSVAVQQVAMTRDAYRALMLGQFKQSGFRINSQRDTTVSSRDAAVWDYEGIQGGRELRWLAMVVVDADRVYLITCTSPKDAFPKYEKEFQACLNSFRLK